MEGHQVLCRGHIKALLKFVYNVWFAIPLDLPETTEVGDTSIV